MRTLDPVTLAVLNGRLVQIADEMDATLYRSAFNPIIAEAHDACHGLYHAETGATLVQGTSGLPIFVGAMAFAVKAVIDKVRERGHLAEGDTYLFNDPYDGGTHLNDFRLVRPVMRAGRVFAWLASVGHWLDVGGNVPGNFNAKATESFQEGFRVPPVKIISGGVLQQDIVDILGANSRVPLSNWGDLNGQLNALGLGERRLHALLDEYGDDTVTAATAALTARAEALMRANIASLPDGTYSYDDFLDNDGVTDEPLLIALDLTIRGDTMKLDFSRSSPPCRGPLNIARSTAVACCYVALKHIFTDVPANAGCLAPIEFVIPDTTLLGVSAPKPVGGYTETILRVIDTVFGAFAKAAPERANGGPYATINALSLAGWRQNGARWVMFCFFGGGLGGNPEGDGLNHGNNPISTATIPPAEILEALYPDHVHPLGVAAGFRRSGPAPRRPRRDLRNRDFGRRRHRCVPARRTRQVSAVRRQWRQAGRAQPLLLRDGGRRTIAAARLQDHRRAYPPRHAGAAGDAGRRRFRRPPYAGARPRRPRRGARLRLGRGGAPRLRRRPRRRQRSGQRRDRAPAPRGARMSERNANKATVGVDVGGTFTDLFCFDEGTRSFRVAKVPSNRGDEAAGFLQGLQALGHIESFGSIVHGTTVGTNTLLERRGPRIGVITTSGFRDVLEMRRRDRRQTWGLWGEFLPIADRDLRLEVDERTLADGTVRTPVDEAAVAAAAKTLIERGAQALAVIFINAYANAENERRALAAARKIWPNEHVSASHQVLPEIREFERASTTALNAYLQPAVGAYIGKLEEHAGQSTTSPARSTSCSRTAA